MLAQIQGSVATNNVEKTLLSMVNGRLTGAQTKQSHAKSNQDSSPADSAGSQAPAAPTEAVVIRGAWAQMPGGFYVRYLPEGFAKIRVQVIVSDAAIAKADPSTPLVFDPTHYLAVYSQAPAQRLGITLRPVAKP